MNKIIGRKPVLEAIHSGTEIEQIYVAFGQKGDIINKIFTAAKKRGIKISQISTAKFGQMFKEENAQGIAALKSFQKYYSVEELISVSKKNEFPLLLLLDSIQDPHNIGAILRTAECSGVDGVIITTGSSAPINETVERTSAGAVSHVKIAKAGNLNNVISQLKNEGFWIVGTHVQTDRSYTSVDYKMPLALVMGNEEKGIRRLVAENCDFLVKIPMKGKIDSLNVSVATGVLLFEINRRRETN